MHPKLETLGYPFGIDGVVRVLAFLVVDGVGGEVGQVHPLFLGKGR